MYKLILVDDEEEVRQGILNKIDWQHYGFEVIGEAENGSAALDLIEVHEPDVVITDIKMPIMDGLELSELLREHHPLIKVVILSGFDDFKYAQRAINFGVVEYALKPILPEDMNALLVKLHQRIEHECRQKESMQELKERYVRSIPVMRDKFLTSLIHGRVPENTIQRECEALNLNIDGEACVIGSISIDKESVNKLNRFENDPNLMNFAVEQIAEEILTNARLGESFICDNSVVIIISINEQDNHQVYKKAYLILDEIRQSVEKYLQFTVTIGMGDIADPFDIWQSYRSAVSALDYRLVIGTNKIIYINDCEPKGGVVTHFDDEKERALTSVIKFGTENEVLKVIDALFADIGEAKTSLKNYQVYLIEIMAAVMRIAKSMELEINDVLGVTENLFVEIFKFTTVGEVKKWLGNICVKLTAGIAANRQASSNKLISDAMKYIDENFNDEELSIHKLSSHLFISQSYLCMLFKKETGDTFLNYLIRVRMEAAKEMLRATKLKTSEIAEKIGYSDPNYFSYFFKRNCGVSPREYRNRVSIQQSSHKE